MSRLSLLSSVALGAARSGYQPETGNAGYESDGPAVINGAQSRRSFPDSFSIHASPVGQLPHIAAFAVISSAEPSPFIIRVESVLRRDISFYICSEKAGHHDVSIQHRLTRRLIEHGRRYSYSSGIAIVF